MLLHPSDIDDALEHVQLSLDFSDPMPIECFSVTPHPRFRVSRLGEYDDLSSWGEWRHGELADLSGDALLTEMVGFRGRGWAQQAMLWTPSTMPAIVIVELRRDSMIGDGRGRVSFALGMRWKTIPAVMLKQKREC